MKNPLLTLLLVWLFCISSVYGIAEGSAVASDLERPRQPFNLSGSITEPVLSGDDSAVIETQVSDSTVKQGEDAALSYFVKLKADYDFYRLNYPDVIAMMDIPQVSYEPVVRRQGSLDYYLTHNLDGREDHKGVNFMDGRIEAGFAQNALIYGHNLNGMERFGLLTQYQNERFFAENAPVVVYDGLTDTFLVYEPFAFIHIVDGVEAIRLKDFESPEERAEYNRSLRERSVVSGVDVNSDLFDRGQSLFLQTCLEAGTLNRGVLALNLVRSLPAAEVIP